MTAYEYFKDKLDKDGRAFLHILTIDDKIEKIPLYMFESNRSPDIPRDFIEYLKSNINKINPLGKADAYFEVESSDMNLFRELLQNKRFPSSRKARYKKLLNVLKVEENIGFEYY